MKQKREKKFVQREKDYFTEHEDFIIRKNLVSLDRCLKLLLIVFIVFLMCTPIIYPGWRPTIVFVGMIPFVLFYAGLLVYFKHHDTISMHLIQRLCLAIYVLVLSEVLAIDLYPRENGIIAYFPIVLAVFPCYFIFRYSTYCIVTALMEVIFCMVIIYTKGMAASTDGIFVSAVGAMMALGSAWILMEARMDDGAETIQLKIRNRNDYLTGVLNKSTSENEIRRFLDHKNSDAVSAFFVIDIDNFKKCNDVYGHQFGDEVLSKTGDLLKRTFRSSDIIGRIGGDEFNVFLKADVTGAMIDSKCQFIQKQMHEILTPDGQPLTCSIGVAISKKEGYEKMFAMADDAMYEAKATGKGKYACFVSKDLHISEARIMIVADNHEMNRATLISCFQQDYQIVEADDGNEVLSLLSQFSERIDIVLIDLHPPGMDGFDILRYMQIRNRYQHIPVLIISDDDQAEAQALQLGACDMIRKPVDMEIMKLRVEKAVKSHKE